MRVIAIRNIVTDKDTHFTGAIAQNAGENEDIECPWYGKQAALLSVTVLSDQNLDFELWLWAEDQVTGAYGKTDMDLDKCLGFVSLPLSTAGKQSGEAGVSTYYYTNVLTLPLLLKDYTTSTDKFKVHMRLVNRSATSKNAGATGEVVLKLSFDVGAK